MPVRCSYCNHAFTVSRDYLAQAMADTSGKKQKFHALECANCRKLVKIPLNLMKRYLPQSSA